jgi:hypothetical protein
MGMGDQQASSRDAVRREVAGRVVMWWLVVGWWSWWSWSYRACQVRSAEDGGGGGGARAGAGAAREGEGEVSPGHRTRVEPGDRVAEFVQKKRLHNVELKLEALFGLEGIVNDERRVGGGHGAVYKILHGCWGYSSSGMNSSSRRLGLQ